MKLLLILLIPIFLFSTVLSCLPNEEDPSNSNKQVNLVYVNWTRATAITNATAAILERLGFSVSIQEVSNNEMWQMVADGEADALFSAWLPMTHSDLWEKHSTQLLNLGPNHYGAKLGLVVPKYVSIDSSVELLENASRFNNRIVGIDPQAGMSKIITKAISENIYGLNAFEYLPGDDRSMVKALGEAIIREEWILVPGWTPHWIFGEWDLKILDDPLGLWGAEETINTLVHPSLPEEKPELYQLLKRFDWTDLEYELAKLMVENRTNTERIRENAEHWVEENWMRIQQFFPPMTPSLN